MADITAIREEGDGYARVIVLRLPEETWHLPEVGRSACRSSPQRSFIPESACSLPRRD